MLVAPGIRPRRHGVQRGVNGLVADARSVEHTLKYAAGLLGREAPAQSVDHPSPQGVAVDHLARYSRFAGQSLGTMVSLGAAVAAGCTRAPGAGWRQWVSHGATAARELTRDGRGAAAQLAGNCLQAATVIKHDLRPRSLL